MFNPSQDDVRRFFCGVHEKARAGRPLDALETLASQWLAEHAEYDPDMADAQAAVARVYDGKDGQANPFLHLSMHLSIAEQVSIDQPPGIRAACTALTARLGEHDAHHQIMECLGEMIWKSQREGAQPDAAAYVDCVRKRAG